MHVASNNWSESINLLKKIRLALFIMRIIETLRFHDADGNGNVRGLVTIARLTLPSPAKIKPYDSRSSGPTYAQIILAIFSQFQKESNF